MSDTGPRGGKTTGTKDAVRKTFWLDRDLAEKLRVKAFEERRPEAEIVREALFAFFDDDQ